MSNSANNTQSTNRADTPLVAFTAFVLEFVYVTADTRDDADIAGVCDDVVDNGFIGTGAGVAIAPAAAFVAADCGCGEDTFLASSVFLTGGFGAVGMGPVGFGNLAAAAAIAGLETQC